MNPIEPHRTDLNPDGVATAGYQLPMADIGQADCRRLGSSTARSDSLFGNGGTFGGQVLPREPQHQVVDVAWCRLTRWCSAARCSGVWRAVGRGGWHTAAMV